MRLISALLLVCITGCSKKEAPTERSAAATTPTSAAAGSGSDSAVVANPAPSAPKLTTERFFKEQYSAFLQTNRGVLMAVGDDPPEHLCGPAIGTAMVRFGTIAKAAEPTAQPEDCGVAGGYTYCTFTKAGGDAKADPDTAATFVFSADEPPALLAVWIGTAVARAKQLEPELAKPRECRRPD